MAETAEARAPEPTDLISPDEILATIDADIRETVLPLIRAAEAAARAEQCEECAKMLEALVDAKLNHTADAVRAAAAILRVRGEEIAVNARTSGAHSMSSPVTKEDRAIADRAAARAAVQPFGLGTPPRDIWAETIAQVRAAAEKRGAERMREMCAQLMETKMMDLTRAYEQPPPMVDWNPERGITPGMAARAAAIRALGQETGT